MNNIVSIKSYQERYSFEITLKGMNINRIEFALKHLINAIGEPIPGTELAISELKRIRDRLNQELKNE